MYYYAHLLRRAGGAPRALPAAQVVVDTADQGLEQLGVQTLGQSIPRVCSLQTQRKSGLLLIHIDISDPAE